MVIELVVSVAQLMWAFTLVITGGGDRLAFRSKEGGDGVSLVTPLLVALDTNESSEDGELLLVRVFVVVVIFSK